MMYEAYKKMVEELAVMNKNYLFPNQDPINASAVITAMLWRAKESVVIFAKDLDDVVFGTPEITSAAHYTLYQDRTIQVLVQEPPGPNSSVFVNSLRDRKGFQLRLAQGTYAQPEARHFVVMDSSGFRFRDPLDPRSGLANFNDPERAKPLRVAFDQVFAVGRDLLAAGV